MDNWKALDAIVMNYVANYTAAQKQDRWEEMAEIRNEMKRVQRELGRVMQAIDTLSRYGVTVS